jgi:uncharacterized protein GlcG (DUF336 family)
MVGTREQEGAMNERASGLSGVVRILTIAAIVASTGGVASAAGLTSQQASAIFEKCRQAAAATPSPLRGGNPTRMWCAVIDREGDLKLIRATDTGGTPANPLGSDAWRGSIEIATAKAWTAVAFSSNDLALDSKTIGLLARPDFCASPPCNDADIGTQAGTAPLFGIGNTNPFRSLTGLGALDDAVGLRHKGIVTFAGGQPVYSKKDGSCGGGSLIGAVGVSGDTVDEDDAVAKAAVVNAGFCLTP